MIGTSELYAQRFVFKRIVFGLCKLAILEHLSKNCVSAVESLVWDN